METLYDTDRKSLAEAAYERFRSAFLRQGEFNEKRVVVGLSGGSSLSDFYVKLVADFGKIPRYARLKARFALLDERRVALDDPQSNFRQLSETVFAPLLASGAIEEFQIIPAPRFDVPNPAQWYYGDVGKIDIGLFGVGEDGHVASLFPGNPALEIPGIRYVEVENSPKPPPSRIGISLDMAKEIADPFVFFIGETKRPAYEKFLMGEASVSELPVMAFARTETVVVTDLKKREVEILKRA